MFATLVAVLQIPVLGLRWRNVVHALASRNERLTRAAVIAVTAIGLFFAQVLPSVAGDGVRAWLLIRLGCDWRNAITSVVIDRAVGVGLLIALGFTVLLLPSGLSAFGGYRTPDQTHFRAGLSTAAAEDALTRLTQLRSEFTRN